MTNMIVKYFSIMSCEYKADKSFILPVNSFISPFDSAINFDADVSVIDSAAIKENTDYFNFTHELSRYVLDAKYN